MNERTLINYLIGKVTAKDLQKDIEQTPPRTRTGFKIENMGRYDEGFTIEAEHLLKICHDVFTGAIRPEGCEIIAYCFISSDSFGWSEDEKEADLCEDVVMRWSPPAGSRPPNFEDIQQTDEMLKAGLGLS